jgi:hexosaminidase
MIKFKRIYLVLLPLLLFACTGEVNENGVLLEPSIIPIVKDLSVGEQFYKFNYDGAIEVENEEQKVFIQNSFKRNKQLSNLKYSSNPKSASDIRLESNEDLPPESYALIINKNGVLIQASTHSGFYYAIQTLQQIFPIGNEGHNKINSKVVELPFLNIMDSPRFKWRGMMLDVSRHFFTINEIKELIDMLSFLKINTFHWHLVDDQGWRIEIKKYPKLTEIGAWRVNQEHLLWNEVKENKLTEKSDFGGYYTQEEIKEVIEYAALRYINVVPEIELPAHVMSAIAAYPELSCKGEQIMVPSGGVWPITEIYCPGKETTFEFIENVLEEVTALFPSKYVHIGGDEATKTNWKTCEHCQKRIKDEKLLDEEGLQSYMIKRVAEYLKIKNRTLIGWDEILEGGLPVDAIVMSWRGIKGGLEAASLKHNVIMSPDTYFYLDHYQGNKKTEPKAIGGFSPFNHVYNFNPIPENMPVEDQKYVIGAQANMWTEYIHDFNHLQYMVFPRMLAVSEVLWSTPDNKNWNDFSKRSKNMFKWFDSQGINYSKSSFNLRSQKLINPDTKQLELSLFNEYEDTEVRYTTNGTDPSINSEKYKAPIELAHHMEVKAQVFERGLAVGSMLTEKVVLHPNKIKGAKVTYSTPYSKKYSSGNTYGLVDEIKGSTAFDDRNWQGWFNEDVEFTIELDSITIISNFELSFLIDRGNQILLPSYVKVLVSKNGIDFNTLKEFNNEPTNHNNKIIETLKSENLNIDAKYLKVKVKNSSNKSTGERGWTFIDELIIEN